MVRMACATDIPNLRKAIVKEGGFVLNILRDFKPVEQMRLSSEVLKELDFYNYFGQKYLETRNGFPELLLL